MTYAELLRKHATDATNEGGMWFSGEYMTMLASMAESIEAENEKLRDLAARMLRTMEWNDRISNSMYWPSLSYKRELRELGVEVGE